MDKFKKSVKKRLVIMRVYSAAIAILLILSTFFSFTEFEIGPVNFALGVCLGAMILVLFGMRKYAMAMRNDESIKRLFIEENDERHKFIIAKTGGHAINIVIFGLLLGAIISGFFNEMIFLSLLGATFFSALVKGCLKWYYVRNV